MGHGGGHSQTFVKEEGLYLVLAGDRTKANGWKLREERHSSI